MFKIGELNRLYLGVQGENGAREIVIDVSEWMTTYPNGTVNIWSRRNEEKIAYNPTGVVFDAVKKTISWTPSAVDTFYAGAGRCGIILTESDVIRKSKDIETFVTASASDIPGADGNTFDYDRATNKPTINGIEIIGDTDFRTLGFFDDENMESRVKAASAGKVQEELNKKLDITTASSVYVPKSSIVNNLNEVLTGRVLDATQGKALKDRMDKQLQFVTPQMFGAVGDGETNDTVAFKSAINTGKMIFVPSGTYLITEKLQLNTDQIMSGECIKTSILKFYNCDGVQLADYADRSGNVLENLQIMSIVPENSDKTGTGLILPRTNNSVINHVSVNDFSVGISLYNSVNNSFYDLFVINNGTGLYATGGSYFNKLYSCVFTINNVAIDGGNASLLAYALDIELSTTRDIQNINAIKVYGGNFEGHNTTPESVLLAGAGKKYVFYDVAFNGYTTAINGSGSGSKLIMINTSFTGCTTEIDAATFSEYFIFMYSAQTAQGGAKTPVFNLSETNGVIIQNEWSASGYITSFSKFISAKKGSFDSLLIDSKTPAISKKNGEITIDFETVPANSTKDVNVSIGSGSVNAWTDIVIIGPKFFSIPGGIMLMAYATPNSTSLITVKLANVTGSDIVVGEKTFIYRIL